MYNRVELIGRLGGDPEIKTLNSGEKVANFSLATSERWTDKQSGEKKEKTEWHRVVVWGKLADIVGQYAVKGMLVQVVGKIRTRKWQDQAGQDRYSTEVVLSGFDAVFNMLGSAGDKAKPVEEQQAPAAGGSSSGDLDDAIPF